MPYFRDLIGADEIQAVVRYVKTFSPTFTERADKSLRPPHTGFTTTFHARVGEGGHE